VSDLIAFQFHQQHHLMALDANCDDPIHGSGPGEIVFRHMSVVQRGVQSRATIAEKMLSPLAGLSVLVRVEKRGDFGLKRLTL
jgi:hypothetical protein